MKILVLHNRYRIAGGEEAVVTAETALLQEYGCAVALLEIANVEIRRPLAKVHTALACVYSPANRRLVAEAIAREQPDILHVHNFFPLLSPSVYYAARTAGVPVVQTLHNYRLICPNALLFRDGHVCEDCVGRLLPWPGIWHACYRSSRSASTAVAAMITSHRWLGTWQRLVDVYIAPTEFARQKFIAGGLPADRIVVKPHFVQNPPAIGTGEGDFVLYVGRLSVEKGIKPLLDAWAQVHAPSQLHIVGDGPLADMVKQRACQDKRIHWLGRLPHTAVLELMRQAAVLVFPASCYETFGLAVAEAFACGLPVIASNAGAAGSLVVHGQTGLLFQRDNPEDLARQIDWALTHRAELGQMRRAARAEFESKYTAQRNYEMLMSIYQKAISKKRAVNG